MIYILYIFLIVCLSYFGKNTFKLYKINRILACVVYILIIGLRGKNVGVDSRNYYEHYYIFGRWGCDFVEYGFDFINRTLFAWGLGAEVFFLVCIIIPAYFIYLSLNRSEYYTGSAIMFYILSYVFMINGMRQGIACGLFIFAYRYIIEKRILLYVLFILIGSLFHASILILLPLYFVLNIKWNIKNVYYIILYISSYLFVFFDFSGVLSYFYTFTLGNRNYSEIYGDIRVESASSIGFIFISVLNTIIFIMIIKTDFFKKQRVLSSFFLLSAACTNLAFNIPSINRVAIYFVLFTYLLLPMLISEYVRLYRRYDRRFVYLFFIIMYSMNFMSTLFSKSNMLLPYEFFWE